MFHWLALDDNDNDDDNNDNRVQTMSFHLASSFFFNISISCIV